MSQENVEIVRQIFERLNRGDVEGVVELCDDEFVMDMTERVFNPDIYQGHAGIRRFYEGVREVWESYVWNIEETRLTGGTASLPGTEPGRRARSRLARRLAVEIAARYGHLGPVLSGTREGPRSRRAAEVASSIPSFVLSIEPGGSWSRREAVPLGRSDREWDNLRSERSGP
jgi:SnoaL-like domain